MKDKKFSRSYAQRKALVRSLLRALLIYERVTTTGGKAKALKSNADRLITWAKKDNLHYRRLSYQILGDHDLVKRLFDVVGPRFKDMQGGYTRVLDLGFRRGDGAKSSLLELTRREEKKDKETKGREKRAGKEKKAENAAVKPAAVPKKKGIISGVRNIFKKNKDAK